MQSHASEWWATASLAPCWPVAVSSGDKTEALGQQCITVLVCGYGSITNAGECCEAKPTVMVSGTFETTAYTSMHVSLLCGVKLARGCCWARRPTRATKTLQGSTCLCVTYSAVVLSSLFHVICIAHIHRLQCTQLRPRQQARRNSPSCMGAAVALPVITVTTTPSLSAARHQRKRQHRS